jgi:hypothetical protein
MTSKESRDVMRVVDTSMEFAFLANVVDSNLSNATEIKRGGKERKIYIGNTQRAFFFPLHCEYWK